MKYVPNAVLPKMDKNVDGASSRFEYFRQAFVAIKERPVFGSGSGTFILQSKRLQNKPDAYSRHAHNFLLEQLTEVGLVGTVLVLLIAVWCLMRIWQIYRKAHRKEQIVLVTLIFSVLLQTLNASMDFSLNYFIVFALYCSFVAVILSFEKPDGDFKSIFNTLSISACVIIIMIFYIGTNLCITGLLKKMPFAFSCCLLSEYASLGLLEKSQEPVSESSLATIYTLHRDNSLLLAQMGPRFLRQASLSDPKNFATQKKYFQFLLENKDYEKVGPQLQFISQRMVLDSMETTSSGELVRKNNLKRALVAVNFLDPSLVKAYSLVDIKIIDDTNDPSLAFAKYYYLLGLETRTENPDLTKTLWSVAMQLAPDWSYFPVELASLYYQEDEYTEEIKILNACAKNDNARNHCESTSFSTMQMPGYFRDDILRMPEKGILADRQNNAENDQKSFQVMELLIKKSDNNYLASYIRELTLLYLSDPEESYLDEINYSDPEIITITRQLLEQDWMDNKVFLAKFYYLFGMQYIEHDSNATKNMWSITCALLPDWSYFSVELAALYAKEADYVQMFEILDECIKNENAKYHCLDTSIANIPIPGYYQSDIMRIPKIGILIESQTDERNFDQKKILDVLSTLVKANDAEKVETFLNSFTKHVMARRGGIYPTKIDVHDKEVLQTLSSAITVLQDTVSQTDLELLAKLYYLIGYAYLDSSPQKTEMFWTVSSQLLPEWSYFAIELASVYHWQKDDQTAVKILEECRKNQYAGDHCRSIDINDMPLPGFFRNNILIIPKTSGEDVILN